MAPPRKRVTAFLNVDLDLRARHGLDELLNYLGPNILVLNRTTQEASVELKKERNSVEEAVLNLIELVQYFLLRAKSIWNHYDFRRVNIGIQAGSEPHEAYFTLSSETVSLLASVQCEIAFTVYALPLGRQSRRKDKRSQVQPRARQSR